MCSMCGCVLIALSLLRRVRVRRPMSSMTIPTCTHTHPQTLERCLCKSIHCSHMFMFRRLDLFSICHDVGDYCHVMQRARHYRDWHLCRLWTICRSKGTDPIFYCVHTIFLRFFFLFGKSQNSGLSNVAENPNAKSWPKNRNWKRKYIVDFIFFGLFCLQNNNIQISVRSMAHLLRCILNGKKFTLSSSAWTTESKKRLIVLFLTTIGLLFARFKVMGSQLPVFTR